MLPLRHEPLRPTRSRTLRLRSDLRELHDPTRARALAANLPQGSRDRTRAGSAPGVARAARRRGERSEREAVARWNAPVARRLHQARAGALGDGRVPAARVREG